MAILTIKVDDNILEEAKRIFDEIGLDTNRAINTFLKKCISENTIPFDLTISNNENWTKMLEKNVEKEEIRKVEKTKTNLDEDIEELVYEGLDV
ncbi:type II toxin-antitoxin system RelB/DinJ family antitoxin [Fusobacterium vincentii]|uniref:type II toxin-antitoxin system RelB/DinJ family antitoxin n=1 Tax=Fusobacterium vincentii TaxID=155615 RepID=UPI0030CF6A48